MNTEIECRNQLTVKWANDLVKQATAVLDYWQNDDAAAYEYLEQETLDMLQICEGTMPILDAGHLAAEVFAEIDMGQRVRYDVVWANHINRLASSQNDILAGIYGLVRFALDGQLKEIAGTLSERFGTLCQVLEEGARDLGKL